MNDTNPAKYAPHDPHCSRHECVGVVLDAGLLDDDAVSALENERQYQADVARELADRREKARALLADAATMTAEQILQQFGTEGLALIREVAES